MAKRTAIAFLGPTVRIWRHANVISIGYDKDNQRFVLGEGGTYTDALKLVAFTLANAAANRAKPKQEATRGQVLAESK